MKKIIFDNFPKSRKTSAKYFLAGLLSLFSLNIFAQSAYPEPQYNSLSVFSNGLFWALLGIIAFLLVIIAVLGGVLKNVAEATRYKDYEEKQSNGSKLTALVPFALLFLTSKTSHAAEFFSVSSNNNTTYAGLSAGLFFTLLAFIALELVIITVLINLIKLIVKVERPAAFVAAKKAEPSLLEKLNASVAIEKEKDIMFDHEYDGIRELDNDLPPWWKYGFYVTIVFAGIYLFHYHVAKSGNLQIAEYNKSVEAAKIAKAEFDKNNANNVNESNVKMLTDKAEIAKGGSVFKETCSACHGQLGEGGVGPNLTDAYWIHGGSIKDIFTTIKYGWPDKGMKSWQADFSPSQISALASYIKTLAGTNPPNAKAPQGDLYSEGGATVTDSTAVVADSTKLAPVTDSIKVEKK